MNRVERGSGMNKEHFIIELKIYLKALNPKDQAIILAKYKALFDARVAEGETEEQVAKSLGKPRVIAEEILKEQGIELTERKIENNGWQEIPASTPAYDHPYEEESEFYYDNDSPYYQRPQHRPLTRFFQVLGIFCLNFFFMFWVILGIALMYVGCGIAGAATLFSPIYGIYSVITQANAASFFQLSMSLFLFGASIIGWLLFLPILKFSAHVFKRYFQWNIAVLRGDI
ncbi:DUF1700 domain-containing protein [Enterococcus faecalis]|uniref:DUF1700 domain-containing protein n=2 Tax=Enterococcus TaxID=1350 RepID=UPI0003529384|nr:MULTISPECIES: DUF1700 domain-containing protein [Enterococcus]EGO6029110.1 DUF1700 domain-containing protein [Enterococcus faecalis]EGO6643480.1 DUF1700 domain-containing protein [Enterococcus faecalis]EGO8147531.1 DUF1700 domain-containing protein [Enterococcus faecalis]EGO8332083.1 DUF1700 domain-containing protein [Enterococcus faecalis]EGO9257819.1 DUF1700 domain-containing protein [Enterococcus faecalis]